MSEQQSIRDELADFIEYVQTKWEADRDEYSQPLANFTASGLLASPVIRRIQAEAIRQAAMEYGGWLNVGSPTAGEKQLYRIADRIEAG